MSLVEWTRLEPGQTEGLVAVMLCRRHPGAVRIRPSSGDGGIDVLVPSSEGWHVYQVKYFYSNLSSGQKGQIEKSYNQLLNYIANRGLVVSEWNLTMPLDPTKENLFDWLSGLTKEAPFKVNFKGLSFLDGLAAEFPDVVDYYLHDGAGRVAQAVSDLVGLLRLMQDVDRAGRQPEDRVRPLQPADLIDGLHSAGRALNGTDPHFSYGISTDPTRPPIDKDEPNLVAAVQSGTDESWVTVKVYVRFKDALNERPIPITVSIQVEDPVSHQALEDFQHFGIPITLDGAVSEFSADLPGGLGGSFSGGSISLGPARPDSAEPYILRAQIRNPDGTPIETIRLTMEPITQGPTGRGVRAFGVEEHGVFELEIRMDLATHKASLDVRLRDLAGLSPTDVLPGLRFADAFTRPNELHFARPYGPIRDRGLPIEQPGTLDLQSAILLVEAYAEVQNHTVEQVILPNLENLSLDDINNMLELARLLRGEVIRGTWHQLAQTTESGAITPGEDVTLFWDAPIGLSQEGRTIWLGYKRTHLLWAHVADVTPRADGTTEVSFVPGADPSAEIRFVPGSVPGEDDEASGDRHTAKA